LAQTEVLFFPDQKDVPSSKSAICRLEGAGCGGRSLSVLKRIAEALNKPLEIGFAPLRRLKSA
jgi:hypothetical protein